MSEDIEESARRNARADALDQREAEETEREEQAALSLVAPPPSATQAKRDRRTIKLLRRCTIEMLRGLSSAADFPSDDNTGGWHHISELALDMVCSDRRARNMLFKLRNDGVFLEAHPANSFMVRPNVNLLSVEEWLVEHLGALEKAAGQPPRKRRG